MPKRNGRLRVKMERLLAEWKRSGEPATSFARRKGITSAKFFYWKRRLSTGHSGSRRRSDSGFVPVRVLSGAPAGGVDGVIEIVLESGARVRVSEGGSEEMLRRTIRVLQESC